MITSARTTNGDGRSATRALQPLACDKHPDTDLEVICPRCEPRNGRPQEEVEQEIAKCVEKATVGLKARLGIALRALHSVHQLLADVDSLGVPERMIADVGPSPTPRARAVPRQPRKARKSPAAEKGTQVPGSRERDARRSRLRREAVRIRRVLGAVRAGRPRLEVLRGA
jgi:hypothetical protein